MTQSRAQSKASPGFFCGSWASASGLSRSDHEGEHTLSSRVGRYFRSQNSKKWDSVKICYFRRRIQMKFILTIKQFGPTSFHLKANFSPKMSHFAKNGNIPKIIGARANPKTAPEGPYIDSSNSGILQFEVN